MTRFRCTAAALACMALSSGVPARAAADEIEVLRPTTVFCETNRITFDEPPHGIYDDIIRFDGISFGERFAGQTLSYDFDFDVLSGSPANPLALLAGAPGENLQVGLRALIGVGASEFPAAAVGEGSVAALLDEDHAEVGFAAFGTNMGTATVDFFRRDGSLIQTVVVTDLDSLFLGYGFRRVGGIADIAGFSIQNADEGGVSYDNFCYTGGVGASTDPTCCPKTQGFWKRQCQGPHPSGEHANLPSYAGCVSASEPFLDVGDEAGICEHLHPDPPSDKCEQARAQAMALLLNVCSGRLEVGCSEGGVGESLQAVSEFLSAPDLAACRDAQALAAGINEAESACAEASDESGGDAESDGGGATGGQGADGADGLFGFGIPDAAADQGPDGGPGDDPRDAEAGAAGVGGSGAACNVVGSDPSLALVVIAVGLLWVRRHRRPRRATSSIRSRACEHAFTT